MQDGQGDAGQVETQDRWGCGTDREAGRARMRDGRGHRMGGGTQDGWGDAGEAGVQEGRGGGPGPRGPRG